MDGTLSSVVVIIPVHYLIYGNVLQDTQYTKDPFQWDCNVYKKINPQSSKVLKSPSMI